MDEVKTNGSNFEELMNCALCPNMCRCECPVLQVTGREATAPAGKARLAAWLRLEKTGWDEAKLEALANCLGCRGCTIHCPFPDLSLCDELLFTRVKAGETGVSLSGVEPYLLNLRRYGSPYGRKATGGDGEGRKTNAEEHPACPGDETAEKDAHKHDATGTEKTLTDQGAEAERRIGAEGFAGLGQVQGPEADEPVLFFAGCTALANNPASLEASRALFKQAGVNFIEIAEDCCGYPAETWGDVALAAQLAEENRAKIAASGAVKLVTNCPECWYTFTERYPTWGRPLNIEVTDGPSFLLDLFATGRLKATKAMPAAISYHDPCIWARRAGKTEQPREILRVIPGLTVVEALASGERTRCCGGGSMFQLTFPGTAAAVSRRRLAEFPAGTAIVTACPFCREGLRQGNREVFELVELLARVCLEG